MAKWLSVKILYTLKSLVNGCLFGKLRGFDLSLHWKKNLVTLFATQKKKLSESTNDIVLGTSASGSTRKID